MFSKDTTNTYFPSFVFYENIENSQKYSDTLNPVFENAYSIFEQYQYNADSIEQRESVFTGHTLQKESPEEIPRESTLSTDWIFGSLLGILLLIGVIIRITSCKFKEFFPTLFAIKSGIASYIAERNVVKVFVYLVYALSAGLLIYFLMRNSSEILFPNIKNQILLYLTFSGIFAGLILLKSGIIRILGSIFETQEISKIYIQNILSYSFVISVLLSISLFLLYFSDSSAQHVILYVLLIILGLLLLVRIIVGFKIVLFESKFSKPYLFYYLCIIEILPILVLAKYVN